MKILTVILIGVQFFLMFSCSSDNESGLRIEISDKYILTSKDVEFYDSSTCMLFLKENINIKLRESGDYSNKNFSIFINDNLIYDGIFFPAYASLIPQSPIYIACYTNDSISTEFLHFKFVDFPLNSIDDRNNSQLVDFYKKNNLLRSGISCTIDNIELSLKNNSILKIDLTIENNDDYTYLIPDLNKISSDQLFSLSGGFLIRNEKTGINIPQILDDYNLDKAIMTLDNLTLLEARDKATFSVIAKYDSDIEKGIYNCEFQFGNISYLKFIKLDLYQNNTRVWIGDNFTKKDFEIK